MSTHPLVLAASVFALLVGAGAGGAAKAQSSGPSYAGSGGKAIYDNICAACHMPGAAGYPGMYPALAKNPKLGAPAYATLVVLKGQGQMPALGRMLNDQQVSDVVNYVRSNFGNTYQPTATPAEVATLRK